MDVVSDGNLGSRSRGRDSADCADCRGNRSKLAARVSSFSAVHGNDHGDRLPVPNATRISLSTRTSSDCRSRTRRYGLRAPADNRNRVVASLRSKVRSTRESADDDQPDTEVVRSGPVT